MSYCVKADILKQLDNDILVQLTDDKNRGVVDDEKVTGAIADADAEIDGYCGELYEVPFATVPPIIRKISVDISIYNLYARRKGAPDDRKDRYNNAVKFLVNVAKGLISLGVDPDPALANENTPDITSQERIFDREKMKDF